MTLSLTPAEAQSKISQIDEARNAAITKIQQIEDSQQMMLGSGWKGGSATTYGHTSTTQNDDLNTVMKSLNHVVDTATTHIHSIANADN
jgi:uncharacterized protein YukE